MTPDVDFAKPLSRLLLLVDVGIGGVFVLRGMVFNVRSSSGSPSREVLVGVELVLVFDRCPRCPQSAWRRQRGPVPACSASSAKGSPVLSSATNQRDHHSSPGRARGRCAPITALRTGFRSFFAVFQARSFFMIAAPGQRGKSRGAGHGGSLRSSRFPTACDQHQPPSPRIPGGGCDRVVNQRNTKLRLDASILMKLTMPPISRSHWRTSHFQLFLVTVCSGLPGEFTGVDV